MGSACSTGAEVREKTYVDSPIESDKAINPRRLISRKSSSGTRQKRWDVLQTSRAIHQQYTTMSLKGKSGDIELRKQFVRRISTKIRKHKIGATWAGGLDNFPEGILIINSDGIIMHSNAAANNMLESKALIGNNILTLIPHKFFAKILIDEDTKEPAELSADNISEYKISTSNGNEIYINMSYTPIVPKIFDEYYGYLIFLRDITEQKLLALAIAETHKKSEDLLASLLPGPILEKIRAGETDIFSEHKGVVAFCDMKGSTEKSKTMPAREVANLKWLLFRHFDKLVREFSVTKIETAGDCYMVACGLFNEENPAEKIIKWGQKALLYAKNELKIDMRFGAHYGEVASCVAGDILPHFQLSGETVNKASRIESMGPINKIHISEEIYAIISNKEQFRINPNTVSLKDYGETNTYCIEII